jgi:hypothetical protein
VTALSPEQRDALTHALAGRPEVARAFLVENAPKPALVFEYDERPATVEAAQTNVHELVAMAAEALGPAAREYSFSAGGPEDVGRNAIGGELVYERE